MPVHVPGPERYTGSSIVPEYTSTEHKLISLWHIPDTSLPADSILARLYFTGGTIYRIDVVYRDTTDGTIRLFAYGSASTLIFTGTERNFVSRMVGENFLLSLEFAQDGADVDTAILVVD